MEWSGVWNVLECGAASDVTCRSQGGPPQPPSQLKFTISDTCDRIKEEFNFLQTQYHA